ncbi:MAG: hypothetical protein ABEN55_09690, partial [Bradymonadaceae bacterium]
NRGSRPAAGTAPGIYFGGSIGVSTMRLEAPDLTDEWREGAVWDLHFGWQVSPRWAVGGQFLTWGTELTLEPVHLHTIGATFEFRPFPDRGLVVGSTTGLALTEGELDNRAGFAQALTAGWRWPVARWIVLSTRLALHGHLYSNGNALFPLVAVAGRYYGITPD